MKFDPITIELEGCICNSSGKNTLPTESDEQYLLYETCEDWEVIYEKLIGRRKEQHCWFTDDQWQSLTEDVIKNFK